MDLVLNNLELLVCHRTPQTDQTNKQTNGAIGQFNCWNGSSVWTIGRRAILMENVHSKQEHGENSEFESAPEKRDLNEILDEDWF